MKTGIRNMNKFGREDNNSNSYKDADGPAYNDYVAEAQEVSDKNGIKKIMVCHYDIMKQYDAPAPIKFGSNDAMEEAENGLANNNIAEEFVDNKNPYYDPKIVYGDAGLGDLNNQEDDISAEDIDKLIKNANEVLNDLVLRRDLQESRDGVRDNEQEIADDNDDEEVEVNNIVEYNPDEINNNKRKACTLSDSSNEEDNNNNANGTVLLDTGSAVDMAGIVSRQLRNNNNNDIDSSDEGPEEDDPEDQVSLEGQRHTTEGLIFGTVLFRTAYYLGKRGEITKDDSVQDYVDCIHSKCISIGIVNHRELLKAIQDNMLNKRIELEGKRKLHQQTIDILERELLRYIEYFPDK